MTRSDPREIQGGDVYDAGTGGAGQNQSADQEKTLRQDAWCRAPRITAALLTVWVLYALVRTC